MGTIAAIFLQYRVFFLKIRRVDTARSGIRNVQRYAVTLSRDSIRETIHKKYVRKIKLGSLQREHGARQQVVPDNMHKSILLKRHITNLHDYSICIEAD